MRTTLTLATILLTLLTASCAAKPSVVGKWKDVDGNVWEFTAAGRVVSDGLTPITYKIVDKDTITWEFEESKGMGPTGSLVLTQRYEIVGDILTITAESWTFEKPMTAEDKEPLVLTRITEGSK